MRFSIDDYQQIVRPVAVDDLDLRYAFIDAPLSNDVLRCLRYMHDIELHTVCYLRDLLVTSAHRDPEVTHASRRGRTIRCSANCCGGS